MPISLGTSTSVMSLPVLAGALVGWPPSYALAATVPAPPSQGSGFTARSSAPSQRSWASAVPASNAMPKAAVNVLNMLASPPYGCFVIFCGDRLRSTLAGAAALNEVGEEYRKDQHGSDHDDRGVTLDAGQCQAVLEQLDEDEADGGADDGADPAENAGAAEHHRGDDIELEAGAHVRARGADARDEDEAGEPAHETGKRIDRELAAIDCYAGEARRRLVVANGVERAAEGG